MKRFKNILFFADGSQGVTPSLQRALNLADSNQARLTLVDVIEPVDTPEEVKSRFDRELIDLLKAQRQQELDDMAAEIGSADSLIYTRLLVGIPFVEVIKLVAKGNYDLVVKVARSPEGLGERLFGSQDLHLLRKCPCPILIDRANSGAHYQRVLAALDARPLDGQGCDEQIVALASSLSSLEQARLYVVHAWQLPGESMFRSGRFHVPSMEIDAMLEHEVLSRKQRLAERLDSAGLAVDDSRVHLVKGRAAETINRVAGDIGADIIVMGTVGRAGIPGLFIGNTAEEVLQSTTRSILAVKPQGFRSPVL